MTATCSARQPQLQVTWESSKSFTLPPPAQASVQYLTICYYKQIAKFIDSVEKSLRETWTPDQMLGTEHDLTALSCFIEQQWSSISSSVSFQHTRFSS